MLSIKEFRALNLKGMKRCSRCGAIKPRERFVKDRRKPDGYDTRCKQCERLRTQRRNAKPERRQYIHDYNARRREDPAYWAYQRAYRCRHQTTPEYRAKSRKYYRNVVAPRRRQLQKPQPGFVYVLQSGPYYKIGISKEPSRRLAEIRPRLPFPIELLHLIRTDNMIGTERFMHKSLNHCRLNGEWFRPSSEELKSLIDSVEKEKRGKIDDAYVI